MNASSGSRPTSGIAPRFLLDHLYHPGLSPGNRTPRLRTSDALSAAQNVKSTRERDRPVRKRLPRDIALLILRRYRSLLPFLSSWLHHPVRMTEALARGVTFAT